MIKYFRGCSKESGIRIVNYIVAVVKYDSDKITMKHTMSKSHASYIT